MYFLWTDLCGKLMGGLKRIDELRGFYVHIFSNYNHFPHMSIWYKVPSPSCGKYCRRVVAYIGCTKDISMLIYEKFQTIMIVSKQRFAYSNYIAQATLIAAKLIQLIGMSTDNYNWYKTTSESTLFDILYKWSYLTRWNYRCRVPTSVTVSGMSGCPAFWLKTRGEHHFL